MPYYENVFIARQDVSATAVEALAERFAAVIKEHGGEVTKKEYWGLRNLAYRIKKNRKGHYVLFNIDGPWPAVQEMERQMRIHEDVVRFLTVRVDELEAGPSVVMQSRSAREDRPRRDDRGRRHGRHEQGPREPSEARPARPPAAAPEPAEEAEPAPEPEEKPGAAPEPAEDAGPTPEPAEEAGAEESEEGKGAETKAEGGET